MVFRGKRSPACATCRARKIKCDFEVPECSQCLRLGQNCPGYRNPLDMLFCDQSKDVVTKARRQGRQKVGSGSGFSESRSDVSRTALRFPHGKSYSGPKEFSILSPRTTYELDDCAIAFFFSHYVLSCDGGFGHLAFLSRGAADFTSPLLTTALLAVGITGLAWKGSSQKLRLAAKQKYCEALSQVNVILHDPVKAAEDKTIAAVMILGLYETITCNSQQSLESWYKHINGALALIKIRGKHQFESEIGLQLFLQLRSQIIMTCVQRSERVPDVLREFNKHAEPFKSEEQILTCQLGDIAANLCEVRAGMQSKLETDDINLMATCIDINNDLKAWAEKMLCRTKFSVKEHRLEKAFEGRCHAYGDLWIAWLWNSYHGIKIMNHRTILGFLQPLFLASRSPKETKFKEQYDESNREIHKASSDIFASVPFHIGTPGVGEPSSCVLGGLFIIWGLYIAARSETAAARDWAIAQLQHVGQMTGIQQASALAQVLHRKGLNNETVLSTMDDMDEGDKGFARGVENRPSSLIDDGDDTRRIIRVKLRHMTDMPVEPVDAI